MTIDRFGFQKKFSVNTTFLDETLIMEGVLDPGETWEDAVLEGRRRMIALVESYAPGKEKKTTVFEVPYGQTPTIFRDDEKLEIAIDNAATLDELKSIKQSNPVMKHPIMVLYNEKLKTLQSL